MWIFGTLWVVLEVQEERMKIRFDWDQGPIRMLHSYAHAPWGNSEGKCFLEGG